MRILIYGAGVIGSLYAALFAEAGYDTNIYARGKRLEFLKKNGLLYKKKPEHKGGQAPDEMRELHKQFYAYMRKLKEARYEIL